MCLATIRNANRVLDCTVGDLQPGMQYRTPEGDTRLVLDQTARPCADGLIRTVSIHNGMPIDVNPSTKLGHDRQGRLYASRFLNPTPAPVEDADEAKNQADKAWTRDIDAAQAEADLAS